MIVSNSIEPAEQEGPAPRVCVHMDERSGFGHVKTIPREKVAKQAETDRAAIIARQCPTQRRGGKA